MELKRSKWWIYGVISVIVLTLALVGGGFFGYMQQLKPVNNQDKNLVSVEIKEGMSAGEIGHLLKEKKLIRSTKALSLYLRLNKDTSDFKVGIYSLSPSQSLQQIVEKLTSGQVEEWTIMFYPGAMLKDRSDKAESSKRDVRSVLKRAGYSDKQIEKALQATYKGQALSGKPSGASLEGYVYGETYRIAEGASAEQVIQRAIGEFSAIVEKHDLEAKYAKKGLTLFEGITLASIVEHEVSCAGQATCEDQRKVAQVFYKRLNEGISLGADATFRYAANQAGKKPTVDFDSPYNTRVNTGLPPGPIGVPGLGALLAVADPAEGDYLFFVSGDDGVNYFSKTEAEHIRLTEAHCHEKCLLP